MFKQNKVKITENFEKTKFQEKQTRIKSLIRSKNRLQLKKQKK